MSNSQENSCSFFGTQLITVLFINRYFPTPSSLPEFLDIFASILLFSN